MKRIKLFLFAFMVISMVANAQSNGKLVHYENFESEFLDARNIDVWLPENYDGNKDKQYPVLYMHDGQNLFVPGNSYGGEEWGVDETLFNLSQSGQIPEVIVVGMWNTPKRYQEYMPQKVFESLDRKTTASLTKKFGGTAVSDDYLKFIVKELKPFIDSVYRTKPDRENTFVMGSSMGGLISIYAISEYPEIFRGAGCLSSHWIGNPDDGEDVMHSVSDAFVEYLSENLPDAGGHLIYFDYGTATLDSLYEPHQLKIDRVMQSKGYTRNKDWITQKFEGHEHNEKYWRERLNIPVLFLLGNDRKP
jgi:predicted alpha/beta superfamily hydrolase